MTAFSFIHPSIHPSISAPTISPINHIQQPPQDPVPSHLHSSTLPLRPIQLLDTPRDPQHALRRIQHPQEQLDDLGDAVCGVDVCELVVGEEDGFELGRGAGGVVLEGGGGAEEGAEFGVVPHGHGVVGGVGAVDQAFDRVAVVVEDEAGRCAKGLVGG